MSHKSKSFSLTLLIIGIFLLVVCGGTVSAAKEVSVALLLPGPITDGGWDQLAYEG